jgi:hypothetical protein
MPAKKIDPDRLVEIRPATAAVAQAAADRSTRVGLPAARRAAQSNVEGGSLQGSLGYGSVLT